MREYGHTSTNDDLAQCDVLEASWQAQHRACQGSEGLLCSLSPSSISDPFAREDLSKRGWSHAWSCLLGSVLLHLYFHPSGSRAMRREEVIAKEGFSFSAIQYRRGSRDCTSVLRSSS